MARDFGERVPWVPHGIPIGGKLKNSSGTKIFNLAHCAAPTTTLQQLPILDAGKGCRVILVCKQQVGTQ